jgi:hypothetical protein
MNLPHEPSAPSGVTPSTDPWQWRGNAVSPDGNGTGRAARDDGRLAQARTAEGAPRPPLRREDYAHIPGWGSDLDRAQRPAVPMERMPPRLETVPARLQQPPSVEVLHSIERPGVTLVFGTTVPPRGVSGAMRRAAFRYSENDLRHWLVLLAADRVQVAEGLLDDLAHGHIPRIYAEMGGRAELRHNPAGAARKALVLAALAGTAWIWWQRQRRQR